MKVLLQRVREASVHSEGHGSRAIGQGLLLFVGIEQHDTDPVLIRAAEKVSRMRVFEDAHGKMNLDVSSAGGKILSIPQFTLCARTDKGLRPSFDKAASGEDAERSWRSFNRWLRSLGTETEEGFFGYHMDVRLLNDGPVTFILEF